MRNHTNHNSGPGAAHGAGLFGFGRRPMLCEQVDGGGGGSSGGNGGGGNDDPGGEGERLFTQTEVNEMMARARREGRNAQQRNGQQQQRQQQPSGGDDRIDRLAGVVEQLAAMLKPPAEQPKPPPTDFRAPGGKVPEMPNNMGLVDIYRLTPEQFGQLTPAQIVEHHRRAVEAARTQNGAVPLPMALRKGGRR